MSAPGNTKEPTLNVVLFGGKNVAVQTHPNGYRVLIKVRRETGAKHALFFSPARTKMFLDSLLPGLVPDFSIPVELLALCSGRRDGWMSRVSFKCAQCGTRHEAREMEGLICQDCAVVDEESAAKAVKKDLDGVNLRELDKEHAALVEAREARHAKMKAEQEAARMARLKAQADNDLNQ